MIRGEIYDARLDPVEGSEQSGTRPVLIVSRNAINVSSPVVVVIPCTTMRPGRKIYPSHVEVHAPDGGLNKHSVLMAEQIRVLDKRRLIRIRGRLSPDALAAVDQALAIALDLPR